MPRTSEFHDPVSFAAKVRLALRVWRSFLLVRRRVKRTPLPEFARELGGANPSTRRYPAGFLSQAVDRSLRLGPYHPRCLLSALVLYRLLRQQGDAPELVIGLPQLPRDHAAHAWVELDGRDVGPPPGKGRHAAIARYS